MNKYKKLLDNAFQNKYAIPQFNINNLMNAKWILEECENMKSPVFIGVSTGAANYMGGYKIIRQAINALIEDLKITVPVILHLDHGKTIEEVEKAIEANFDSIMFDGSEYSLKDNIDQTNKIKTMVNDRFLEAEIGEIGNKEALYTTLEAALNFSDKIAIDMLAPAVGSVHGIYKDVPNIQFDLIAAISNATKKPLVLHGGTGLDDEIIKKCIKNGICKINFNTELQLAWSIEVRQFLTKNSEIYDPRKIISAGEQPFKEVVRNKIILLNSKNKG